MHSAAASRTEQPGRHRPSRITVFTTAFVAGAAVAFGVNRVLDLHLAQARPQVECEPIFVALHSLPQGSPVTVWDVALKDWPRAMLPSSALRARDTFEGMLLRHPLREGQPLLSVQLVPAAGGGTIKSASVSAEQPFTSPLPATPSPQAAAAAEADLWTPAAPAAADVAAATARAASRTDVDPAPAEQHVIEPAAPVETFVAPPPAAEPAAVESARVESSTSTAGVDDAAEPAAESEPVAVTPAREPTLAAVPEPAFRPQPEPQRAQPELLASTVPLFAPVPASPPADLDGPLAGVGGLPATEIPAETIPGKSVLDPETTPAPPAVAPPQAAGRYLVVPERIALQADASFAAPPAVQPPAAAQRLDERVAAEPAPQPADRQSTTNGGAGQRAGAKRPQQPQSLQGNARQGAATAGRPRGGMFPNLTAGIEALSGSQRKPTAAAQPSSTKR